LTKTLTKVIREIVTRGVTTEAQVLAVEEQDMRHHMPTPEPTHEDPIPTNPTAFKQLMAIPLPAPAMLAPPQRCRARPAPTALPRRSDRLARKAIHRTPSVVATQNLLMKYLCCLCMSKKNNMSFNNLGCQTSTYKLYTLDYIISTKIQII
jgi:hypothetical protein